MTTLSTMPGHVQQIKIASMYFANITLFGDAIKSQADLHCYQNELLAGA